MNTQTTKNYFTDGGDTLVIGGKLTVEAGAEVTGIDGTVTKAQLITAQKYDSEQIYTTYNGDLSVSETMGACDGFQCAAHEAEDCRHHGCRCLRRPQINGG